METLVKDTVNLGIGAYATMQEQAEKVVENTQQRINDLISLGANASDESAVQVKDAVQNAVSSATELQQKAQLFVEEIVEKVKGVTIKEETKAETKVQA